MLKLIPGVLAKLGKRRKNEIFAPADLMRLSAMLGVVLIHVLTNTIEFSQAANGSSWWVREVLVSGLRWVVPMFVMLSGALLLSDGKSSEKWADFFRKRFARVGIPLLVWSFVYFIWLNYVGFSVSIWSHFEQTFVLGYPVYHFYFLYIIVGLYLVTPVLRLVLKRLGRKELLWIVVFLLVISSLSELSNMWFRQMWHFGALNAYSFFVPYLGYFLLGHYLHKYKVSLGARKLWGAYLLSATATVFGSYLLMEKYGHTARGLLVQDYLSPFIVVMSIAVFLLFGKLEQQRWLRAKILVKLSELSFGVYLVHWIVRHHTLGVFEQYYSVSYELWWYFAVSVIVILLSVIISWLISLLPWLKRDIR